MFDFPLTIRIHSVLLRLIILTFLASSLFLSFIDVFAQENEVQEIEASATGTVPTNDKFPSAEGLTEEDIAILLEEAKEIDQSAFDEVPLAGVVVAITAEGEVLLETQTGELVVFSQDVQATLAQNGSTGSLLTVREGDTLMLSQSNDRVIEGTVSITQQGEMVIIGNTGVQYELFPSTTVLRGAQTARLSDLFTDEVVVLIVAENGSVKALQASEVPVMQTSENSPSNEELEAMAQSDMQTGRNLTLWIVGGLLFLAVLGFLLFR